MSQNAVSSGAAKTYSLLPAETQRAGAITIRLAPTEAAGMLVRKVPPVYPLEAKVERVQGTVVLKAIIARSGEVSDVNVVSGPPLLQSAAVEAVRQWRYRPYVVNGQPAEVETTIQVLFGVDASQLANRLNSAGKRRQ